MLLWASASCAGVPRTPADYPAGYRESGNASWYGGKFHGRATASGEIYNMNGLTAAHRLMPLGTRIRVTNRENGKTVTVRVNDRGPFVRGRILDLSYGAARELDMIGAGTARVLIEVLNRAAPATPFKAGPFTVQVGSFESEDNARQVAQTLSGRYENVYIVTVLGTEGTIYRVRVGNLTQETRAVELAERLAAEDQLEGFVTRKDR